MNQLSQSERGKGWGILKNDGHEVSKKWWSRRRLQVSWGSAMRRSAWTSFPWRVSRNAMLQASVDNTIHLKWNSALSICEPGTEPKGNSGLRPSKFVGAQKANYSHQMQPATRIPFISSGFGDWVSISMAEKVGELTCPRCACSVFPREPATCKAGPWPTLSVAIVYVLWIESKIHISDLYTYDIMLISFCPALGIAFSWIFRPRRWTVSTTVIGDMT